jgi:hypothetical protein
MPATSVWQLLSGVKQIAYDANHGKVPLPRHRTVPSNPSNPSSRYKAIALITAGAFSVVGAASAVAATGTREPARSPAGAVQAAAAIARPAIAVRFPRPQASPQAVSLAVRAFQIRATQDAYAAARWQDERRQAQRRAAAARARAAAVAAQSQAAAPSQAAQSQAPQSQAGQPQQEASTPTAQPVASGSPEQIAEAMLGSFGWSSSQFSCLYPLWEHESGWSVTAANPDGAYGIPQALPGAKMAGAGADWQTDAATQIRWGLEYIQGVYGSPCGAWDHEQATGWY